MTGDKKYLFESETCSRCGGTGKYSFCERYRDICFKCAGNKTTLTKRGIVAQAYLDQLQTVSLKDLQVGAVIECTGITHGGSMYRYKAPVVSVEPDSPCTVNGVLIEYVLIKTKHPKLDVGGMSTPANGTVRVWPNSPENIAKALEYQGNLTKTGTVRKTKQTKGDSK